jgi:hypothetical protein
MAPEDRDALNALIDVNWRAPDLAPGLHVDRERPFFR